MTKIISDNPKVSKILHEICEIIEGQGGSIHPDITIKCQDNDISVISSTHYGMGRAKDFAFKIPHELMVVYDDFVFEMDENQKIHAHSHINDVTPQQLRLTNLMLDLYNATDKLQTHIKNCIWHTFKNNKEIISLLIKGRQGLDLNLISKFIKDDDINNLSLLTFFKTRLLDCQLHDKDTQSESIIMPLVDAMNHHLKGAPYQNFYTPKGAFLTIPLVQPVEGNNECFVQYGVFDNLDTYMHYGFMAGKIPFLRSIPLTVDLGEWGSIEIKALNSYVQAQDVPDGFKDLTFYMPIINADHDKKHVVLSHIMIPTSAAPKSLRRIISLAIRLLHPKIDTDTINSLMLDVEAKLWKSNKKYYQSIQESVEKSGLSATKARILHDLSQEQISILNGYKALMP